MNPNCPRAELYLRENTILCVQTEMTLQHDPSHITFSLLITEYYLSFLLIILALCFFLYQYGLVYHLSITDHNKNVLVYAISWMIIFLILGLMKGISVGRRRLSADFQLVFRLIEGSIFITFLSILIILIVVANMTLMDLLVCILAVMPTGWGMLQIAQACKPLIEKSGFWGSVRALARGYEVIIHS